MQILQGGSDEEMARVMEQICRLYWKPIFSFLRHNGKSLHDAEDLTQAFFEKIITEEALREARRERGRLRSFMLGMLRRFVSRRERHDRAGKREGSHHVFSLDEMREDGLQEAHLLDEADPVKIYDRLWARQVASHASRKLQEAFKQQQRGEVFEGVEAYLVPDAGPPSYRELAVTLNSTESAARQMVHRLRKKFAELLEQEVARTVMQAEDVAAEMEWLRRMMAEE